MFIELFKAIKSIIQKGGRESQTKGTNEQNEREGGEYMEI